MKKIRTALLLTGAGLAARAVRARTSPRRPVERRWLTVTVHVGPEEVGAPEPLARLGDAVELVVRPAPGDKGTELLARPRATEPTAEQVGAVRAALRDAKSVLETGEVLLPDAHPSTHPGPAGKLLAKANAHAKEVGRL
jgi:hypothetical protein